MGERGERLRGRGGGGGAISRIASERSDSGHLRMLWESSNDHPEPFGNLSARIGAVKRLKTEGGDFLEGASGGHTLTWVIREAMRGCVQAMGRNTFLSLREDTSMSASVKVASPNDRVEPCISDCNGGRNQHSRIPERVGWEGGP